MPQGLQDRIDQVASALRWVGERWVISDLPPRWMIVIFLVAMAALVVYQPTWRILRHAATIVHEMGHVIMAWAWGRRVRGIRLHSDTSGLAITAGKPRGLGVLMTFMAGYPAPALVGLGLVWASVSGYSGVGLTALMVLLAVAFLLVRNLFGLLTLSVALLGAGAVFWVANPQVVTGFTVAAGLFLILAGTRTCCDLWVTHRHGEGAESDAAMAAQHSLLPASAWIIVFSTVSAVCAAQAVIVALVSG